MKVLICVASKHGGSEEIGRFVAHGLRERGLDVDVIPPSGQPRVAEYDAFVIGSGVYMGRWLGEARAFVEDNVAHLRGHPVWLFSSGPITDANDPHDSAEGEKHLAELGGREHRLFPGRLERDGLGWSERAIVRMVGSPWGDYRPWDAISAWVESIATELTAVAA